MASYDYDVIVIGSGAGGTIAAQQLAKAGRKVALIEMSTFGGSASTTGRVPVGALLHSAAIHETAKHGAQFGVRGTTISYNYPTIKSWKDLVVDRTGLRTGEQALISMGINVLRGRAHFIDPHTITIGAARLTSKEFLIASGSEAILPNIVGLSKSGFLTPKEVVNLTRLPKSVAIIGSGQQGCEFAQFFASLGTKVHIIEKASRIIPEAEPEASEELQAAFGKRYPIDLLLECDVESVESVSGGKKLRIAKGGRRHTLIVDDILVITAKKAATDIGLENAGVIYEDGAIVTDAHMRTSVPHIFAAGSCTTTSAPTHLTAYQSQVIAHNILHPKKQLLIDYRAVPRVLFTTPEVATVGPTEAQLRAQGIDCITATAQLSVVARANITDFDQGFVKVISNKKTGVLLGATIVAPQASEMIHELTLAIQNYLSVSQVAHTLHAFPTWSEAIRVACAKLALS